MNKYGFKSHPLWYFYACMWLGHKYVKFGYMVNSTTIVVTHWCILCEHKYINHMTIKGKDG